MATSRISGGPVAQRGPASPSAQVSDPVSNPVPAWVMAKAKVMP